MNIVSGKSVIGLSLHTDQFYMVEVKGGTVQALATRELVQPFNMKAFRSKRELVSNQGGVLRDLYQKIESRSDKAAIALNAGMVFVKKVSVALGLNEDMLKEHMLWEAGQSTISSIHEYIMDYQKLPFQTPAGNPLYLLILVRKSVLEGIRALMESVGLRLQGIDVDIFSIIRALLANYDIANEDTSVLVDIQREYCTIVFIRNREFFLSHRVLFRGGGFVAQDDLSELVTIFMKELRRLVFGHHIGRGIEDLSHIYLMGNDLVKNVFKELSSVVTAPLDIVNPFRRIDVVESVTQSKAFNNFPERFVASVGIALKNEPVHMEKNT